MPQTGSLGNFFHFLFGSPNDIWAVKHIYVSFLDISFLIIFISFAHNIPFGERE